MMERQIRPLLNQFLKNHPKVQVELELSSRRVDVLHDDIDLAIRTNFAENEDSSIIVRDVIKTVHCLVVSPEVLQGRVLEHITELSEFPSIVLGTQKNRHQWHLHHLAQQEQIEISLNPRIKSNDLAGAYYAVLDGLGIADLPYLTVKDDIEAGRLIHLFPEWCSNVGTIQLVYASRKGQRLVMEQLIEYLVEGIREYGPQHDGYLI